MYSSTNLQYSFRVRYNTWRNKHKLLLYYRQIYKNLRGLLSYPILAVLSGYIEGKTRWYKVYKVK